MEAEYVAATETGKDIILLRNLIKEISETLIKTTILCDNEAAIGLALKCGVCENRRRTGHMKLRNHIMRDWIEVGLFNVVYVSSEENIIADVFTKLLRNSKFLSSRKRLRLSE